MYLKSAIQKSNTRNTPEHKSASQKPMLKSALLIAASLFSFTTSADWSARLNHLTIKDDFFLARNVSHQATTIGLGYQYDFTKNYYLSTNAFLGLNYDSDRPVFSSSETETLELEKLHGMDIRFGYRLNDWFSPFIGAQYLRQEHSRKETSLSQISSANQELTQSDTNFLIGAEFNLFYDISIEVAYSDKKYGNLLLLGLNYTF